VDTRAAYVTVARILRPHGRRGEVAAEVLTDFPQRLKSLKSAELHNPRLHTAANGTRLRTIRSCWLSHSRGGQAIFHFEGCDSIDDAKKLVGLEVQIPLADRVPLPQGTYYATDLVGCEVVEQLAGQAGSRPLGSVREVQFAGEGVQGTPNLAINTPEGELLVPLALDICTNIDLAARRITVILPEGLRDLNLNIGS
jgi:16S rRNA processing protein RimM